MDAATVDRTVHTLFLTHSMRVDADFDEVEDISVFSDEKLYQAEKEFSWL